MRAIISVLLFLFSFIENKEQTVAVESCPTETKETKADFRVALKNLMSHEGFYVNHPVDRGKETYCGISRVFSPQWKGWEYVDKYKRAHKLVWNDSIPEPMLDWLVKDHYLDIWIGEKYYDLEDQEIANYLFDFRVNSPYANNIIRRSLNEMDSNIPLAGIMDSTTVKTINNCDKNKFMLLLLGNRAQFYCNIVIRDKSQLIFLGHWITRTKIKA